MKKSFLFVLCVAVQSIYGAPLVDVANEELEYSNKFVRLERIQQKNLFGYVKLVKAHYISIKEQVWLSAKIIDAIDVQSRMILVGKFYGK